MNVDQETATKHKRLLKKVKAKQARRRRIWARRDKQVQALYPVARTFEIQEAHPVGCIADCGDALERLPQTLTLITPDHSDPSQDHLFFGSYPVLSKDLAFDPDFQELTFSTSDGEMPIRGHLRLSRSRTRAIGVIEYAGHSFSVDYEVKPQRYKIKIAKDAAYVAGTSTAPAIKWDTESSRWKDAKWSEEYELGFTYGVNGQEIIGDEKVYTFVASFDDVETGKKWKPFEFDYTGLVDSRSMLKFALQAGANPPSSGGEENLFPYILRAQFSEFAVDFAGGMLCDEPSLQGTVYGLKGDWAGAHVAGLYHLHTEGAEHPVIFSVHDGQLHVGHTPVSTTVQGNVLHWRGLSASLARESGLPEEGYVELSGDGGHIVRSSLGVEGRRIHPDQAAEVASTMQGPADIAASLKKARTLETDGHKLTDLLRMSQYARDEKGNYYDQIQSESMTDFYDILLYYMDEDLRKKFFRANKPDLSPGVLGIAQVPGKDGQDAKEWYKSLAIAYTSSTLGKWSNEEGANQLNSRRADAWLKSQTATSEVMQAQAPLLYARRYALKYTNLDWFLEDQKVNAAQKEKYIDDKVAQWKEELENNLAGDDEAKQKVIEQVEEMGRVAKEQKLYWAFAVYAYASTPAYLNLMQTVMMSGDEIDGSEFAQRVQRTVAILNVLDTSSYFSSQYAYMLQLFQVSSVLPELMDYSGEIEKFNFAVKKIIDKFIEDNINSQDPKMRETAEKLRKNASNDTVTKVLAIFRESSAALGGLYNWTTFAAAFESKVARVLSMLPSIVVRMIGIAAVGLMINFFVTGQVNWNDLTGETQAFIIATGALILVQLGSFILSRGIAFGKLFTSGAGFWQNTKLFFSPSLLTQAEELATTGFKGWILGTQGYLRQANQLRMQAQFMAAVGNPGLAAKLTSQANRIEMVQKIFGRNLNEFLSTRLGAALAVLGIVMSAISLAQGGVPMEIAANALFLAASVLEFIATAGLWATSAFSIATIGGIAVGTIFTVLSVVGVIAMVAGVVLMLVLLFQPKKSPVQEFAEEKAGVYYMPFKTEIDYFQDYQTGGSPQRSGVSVTPGGESTRALYVGSDGALAQKPFDASGHTAFYLRVDEFGRAQIGAPIRDSEGNDTFLVLGLDESGKLVAKAATDKTLTNQQMLWHAKIQGEGTYEGEYLRSASFKLYNEAWLVEKEAKLYIAADGETGWKADSIGTSLTLTMVTTKPQELRMPDIEWFTYEHDKRQLPGLSVVGSEPRSWTLEGDLPQGLLFDAATGAVQMEIGVDVPAAPSQEYKLSVSNPAGSDSTSFRLEVKEPETIAPLEKVA